MTWKVLKLISVIVSIIGIAWLAGGQAESTIPILLLIGGVAAFIACRIFEPKND